jgi:methyl-accepting chemotaxis protein
VFGKKQELTKELEEKLNMAQFQLEHVQMQMNSVQNYTQQMLPHFESQITAQGEMDKELTKVVNQAYETLEETGESTKVLEQLAMELTSMRGQMEDEEQDKRKLQEVAGRQIDQMATIVEENKNSMEPVSALQETKTALKNHSDAMQLEVGHMLEYAKQMTVSSLSCAIEAGRMGDSGKGFVEASEDVRMLSSAYERAAQVVARQLNDMEKRLRQLDEQVAALLKSNKDTNASISRLSKNITQQDEICTRAAERHYLEKAAAISEYIKKLSQSTQQIDTLQHQTLSDIENIGTSFMNEQEARKGLETIVDQLIGNMR